MWISNLPNSRNTVFNKRDNKLIETDSSKANPNGLHPLESNLAKEKKRREGVMWTGVFTAP